MNLERMELKDITDAGSEATFGYSFSTRTSFKPPYIVQSLFRQVLGYNYVHKFNSRQNHEPFEFVRKPSDIDTSDLDDEILQKIKSDPGSESDEKVDNFRLMLRKTLRNDRTLYIHDPAPTASSDWLVGGNDKFDQQARFIWQLIKQAEKAEETDQLENKIETQLQDHSDGVSLLMRPLLQRLSEKQHRIDDDPESMQREISEPPEWEAVAPSAKEAYGGAVKFDRYNELIGTELIRGYSVLSQNLRTKNSRGIHNYPRDLQRSALFGILGMYLYTINRASEIDQKRNSRPPILLNCTGERDSPIGQKSRECVDLAYSQIRKGTKIGIQFELKDRIDEEDVEGSDVYDALYSSKEGERFSSILDLKADENGEDAYIQIQEMYDEETNNPIEDLADVISTITHLSSHNTYPARDAFQFLAPKAGFVAPRGGGGNVDRHFDFTENVLETIILSLLGPDENISLNRFCEEMRKRYGIIVGGTDNDYDHLSEWGKKVPATDAVTNPLEENYESFKEKLIDMGYAVDQADTVTLIETPQNLDVIR